MSLVSEAVRGWGLEVGRRRVLHPGPLRWLRALGWMVALFVLTMAISAAASLPAADSFNGRVGPGPLGLVALICVVGLVIYALVVWLGEGRRPEELSLRHAPLDLVLGLGTGAVMFAAVVAIMVALGAYQISGPRHADPTGALTMALASGVTEELVIRAVVFRLLMRAFGVWPALGLSAALFGAMHLANPNATATAAAAIAIEAGVMLAGFYLVTGRLWVSIGVHAAWNFVQAFVFGCAVSGHATHESLLVSKPTAGASEMVTGGAFGPEASLPAIVVCTLVGVGTLIWAGRRGNLKPRPDEPIL